MKLGHAKPLGQSTLTGTGLRITGKAYPQRDWQDAAGKLAAAPRKFALALNQVFIGRSRTAVQQSFGGAAAAASTQWDGTLLSTGKSARPL
jgi:hypothetical protein